MMSTLLSPRPMMKIVIALQGLVEHMEDAFTQWQAKRLQEIPEEKLWAQAMFKILRGNTSKSEMILL